MHFTNYVMTSDVFKLHFASQQAIQKTNSLYCYDVISLFLTFVQALFCLLFTVTDQVQGHFYTHLNAVPECILGGREAGATHIFLMWNHFMCSNHVLTCLGEKGKTFLGYSSVLFLYLSYILRIYSNCRHALKFTRNFSRKSFPVFSPARKYGAYSIQSMFLATRDCIVIQLCMHHLSAPVNH